MKNDITDFQFDMALQMNKRDAMYDMVESGYEINKVRDDIDTTILNKFVVMRGNVLKKNPKDMEATILKNKIWDLVYAGADPEAFDNNQTNSLLLAVLNNDSKLLEIFLSKNPDLSILYEELSLIDIAILNNYTDIVNLLMEYTDEKVLDENGDFLKILNPQSSEALKKIAEHIDQLLSQTD